MDASRKLTQAVRDSLKQEKLIDGENITILIRIFANMNDLSKTLHLSKVISGRGDLSIFAEQFTTSRGEYDFINVGPGKENADSKMRGRFSTTIISWQRLTRVRHAQTLLSQLPMQKDLLCRLP